MDSFVTSVQDDSIIRQVVKKLILKSTQGVDCLARRFTKLDRDRVYASHERYYKQKIRRAPRPLTKEQFRKMVMRDRGMNPEDYEK